MSTQEAIEFMSDWYDERTNAYIEWCFGDIEDVVQDIGTRIGLEAEMRVLDIGCNNGSSSFHLAEVFGCSVVGVDAARSGIEVSQIRAQRNPPRSPVVFHLVDARDTPFESAEFDAVVSKDTFVNIVDRPRLISEICRVLKPGGHLSFCDWMQGNEEPGEVFKTWREFKKEEPFEMLLLREYEALLKDSGFIVTCSEVRVEVFQERIKSRYETFAAADPEEMQRRFGIEDHAYFVERFGLTLQVLLSQDVVWGHMAAKKIQ
jgi:ubiquinone/menaquinone biosynthesis C-methylase UbiE